MKLGTWSKGTTGQKSESLIKIICFREKGENPRMRFLALLYRGPLIKIVKCILFKQKLASLIPGGKGIYDNLDQSILVIHITTFETSV